MKPGERARLVREAEAYFRSGSPGLAKIILETVVQADRKSAKAFELLGYIHGNEGQLDLAHESLEKACALPGHSPEALYYLGVSHLKRREPQAAVKAFGRAIALGGSFFEALHDLGTAHSMAGDRRAALQAYLKAEGLRADSFDLLFNIGKVFDELKEFPNAMRYYDRAQKIDPEAADVWAHKGAVFYDSKRYEEAILHWEKALSLEPGIEWLPGFLAHARLRLCDWREIDRERVELPARVEAGERVCGPFEMLAIAGDERIQQRVARSFVAANFPSAAAGAGGDDAPGGRKTRIGYFSADFGRHAVSYLTAELFERHDRDAFEIFGFALAGAATDDPMRARLARGFDRFFEVEDKSDADVVDLARKLGLDIAVDLGGHTKGSRSGIFQRRAAPVQVNFLGYPGTMGADFIDYMIADETVIPAGSEAHYTERVAYLPCFQPSDTTRLLPDLPPARAAFGLPESGFVFCCFNNSYKITPEVFESWMRILRGTPGSSLWLLADVEQVERNLRGEAARRGVDPQRLIFGGPLPMAEYLDRYRCADLFLDTLPFNAGTTASDALWAGLPILTRPGGSFAGRMAASLLHALDLPELVAPSQLAYEAAAIRLALHPDELAQVRNRLAEHRGRGRLFDMANYTRHLETAYAEMLARHRAGLPPAHVRIE